VKRLVVLALLLAPSVARADDASDVVKTAEEAMSRGAVREAIEAYEGFADRGGQHPDVSFDRGVAYLTRARSSNDRPGDLGRAAAAFEEALLLRSGDADAEAALEAVRAEVAHRRARGGATIEVAENPSAWRAVVSILPESVWATLALASAIVLALGLALRKSEQKALHLAGSVSWVLGLVCSLAFTPLAALAREVRKTTEVGVVVAPEARLLDDRGVPTSRAPIPEAARVDVTEHRGGLVKIRWGTVSGMTAAANVRIVRLVERLRPKAPSAYRPQPSATESAHVSSDESCKP
jgi:predicted outer membrane lipoprotein